MEIHSILPCKRLYAFGFRYYGKPEFPLLCVLGKHPL